MNEFKTIQETKLKEALKETAKEWLYDTKDFTCYMDVNSGSCGEFALSVIEKLPKDSGVEIVTTNTFMEQKDIESYGNNREFSNHVWLMFQGKHYDIERINGVENFLDLPYFQREIKCKELGIIDDIQLYEMIKREKEKHKVLICDMVV